MLGDYNSYLYAWGGKESINIGWTKNLALDYSANPTSYKKLKELTDFHDTKSINELEDKRNKEI